jgi:hypothetical protein
MVFHASNGRNVFWAPNAPDVKGMVYEGAFFQAVSTGVLGCRVCGLIQHNDLRVPEAGLSPGEVHFGWLIGEDVPLPVTADISPALPG